MSFETSRLKRTVGAVVKNEFAMCSTIFLHIKEKLVGQLSLVHCDAHWKGKREIRKLQK